ncbi:MAG: hypothetical protein OQL08_01275 [Gammaproteobacteria bacterium]|nr:hypothetical protein [Gammaproteobacteria bacterium]
MQIPKITTAIPQRRYQLGDFAITVLGEVESGDERAYRYLLATVQDGKGEPCLYVAALKVAGSEEDTLRLIAPNMERDLDSSTAWRDLDHFCEQGISIVQQVLGLKDEQAHRLM